MKKIQNIVGLVRSGKEIALLFKEHYFLLIFQI